MKMLWQNYRSVIIDVIARALRTMAQTAVGAIGGGAILSEVDWALVLSASALAGLCSLLMSVDRIAASVIDNAPASIQQAPGEPP